MWSEHCGYKHSALLLRRLPSEGDARAPGAWRERRRARPRRRPRRCLQGREPQPPVRRRAVPGRRDGGRGHPQGHLGDGRAPDRPARRAALRGPGRSLLARRRWDRRYGNSRRRPERRRRGRLRRDVCLELSRQRDVRGAPSLRARDEREGDGCRRTGRRLRRHHGARRDRGRLRARERRARGGGRRQAPHRSGRRPVHREPPHRGVARAGRAASSCSPCRTAAPRGSPRRCRRWPRSTGSTSISTASRCGRRGWSRGR